MLQKHFKLEVKSVEDDGTFTGYASVTGNVDSDNEVIDKGAFKRTLDHTKGIVPILWQHDRTKPVGWNLEASEDAIGLAVKGKLMVDTELGRYAQSFLKTGLEAGAKPGLSIGFTVPKGSDYVKTGRRHFKEIAWKEYSIATFQSNLEAVVTGAKEDKKSKRELSEGDNQKDFNESLTEARNMSALYQERCDLESALYDAIQDALGNAQLSTDDKKSEIEKSYTQYAAAMADWYSRFIDADTDNDPEEDDMDGKNEKAGRAISAATAEQIKQAMGHLTDAGAMHQKALGILTSLSKQAYTANDVNQPNPVGEGKEEKAASDPDDTHSLEELLELVRSVDGRTKAA